MKNLQAKLSQYDFEVETLEKEIIRLNSENSELIQILKSIRDAKLEESDYLVFLENLREKLPNESNEGSLKEENNFLLYTIKNLSDEMSKVNKFGLRLKRKDY